MNDGLTWIELPAELPSLARFTAFAREGARAAGLPEPALGKLDLILEEILVNIFRYAYPSASGTAAVGYAVESAHCLRVEVRDSGRAFDPLQQDAPDLDLPLQARPLGGLGIFLVQTLAESVRYHRESSRNILTFLVR